MIKKLSVNVFYKNVNHPKIQQYTREKLDGFAVSDDHNFLYFINIAKLKNGDSKELIKWIPIKDIMEMDIETVREPDKVNVPEAVDEKELIVKPGRKIK